MKKFWIFLAALLAAAAPAFAELAIHGEPAIAQKATVTPRLRLAPLAAPTVTLAPVSAAELAPMQAPARMQSKRTIIGIERTIDPETHLPQAKDLAWKAVPGGVAAQVAVSSPQAGAMRLAIDLAGVADDVEMVIFGSAAPERLEGPVRVKDIRDRTAPWWTPITDGDTQTVEFFVPAGSDAAAQPIRIAGTAHLFTTLASGLQKLTSDIGTSGSCNVDIKCSALYPTPAFQNMRSAVAQMVFNDARNLYVCTGQLLNDTDTTTQIPWFFSANHCFDNESAPFKTASQMQTIANTLSTLWFFEAVTCSHPSDPTVPPYVQLSNGSTYLYNNPSTDVLFIRLNDPAPTGAFFAGWSANALAVGTAVVVAHHPEGDLKKVSQGSVVANSLFPGASFTTLFHEVKYNSGTTEPGSSGAGIYTFDGTQYQLRGALFGGGAACNALTDSDWYSQFDQAYPALAQYLSPAVVPAYDYSDLWWNPNESGWGLNLVQHPSHQMFGAWYTYAANSMPIWYMIPGGTWTSTNTFTGTMYVVSGPSVASGTFNAASVVTRQVGTATLTFTDANNGTFSYTVDGVAGSKTISRIPF